MSKTLFSVGLGVLLLSGINVGFAAEEEQAAVVTEQPAMTPEQEAMMAKMKDYSTPNENHQILSQLTGRWNTTVKCWMDANSEANVFQGSSNAQMIMGGRFLQQTFDGTFMDQPFEGSGIFGYDNLRKEYVGIWYDNMATGIMISSGQYNPATKTLAEEGTLSCPLTNGKRSFRAVTKIIDENNYTYETFMTDEKGQEFRSMEILYTRQK